MRSALKKTARYKLRPASVTCARKSAGIHERQCLFAKAEVRSAHTSRCLPQLNFSESPTLRSSAPDAPPLYVMHGLLGSLANWRSITNRIGKGRRVFTVDLRNHGESFHNDDVSIDSMMKDVSRLIEHHQANLGQHHQEVIVMGHSLGGKVAMSLALARPDLVGKLVVVDISPVNYEQDSAASPQWNSNHNVLDALMNIDLNRFKGRPAVDKELADKIADPAIRSFVLTNLVSVKGTDGSEWKWRVNLPALHKGFNTMAEFSVNEHLSANGPFTKDVLFVAGEKSKYITWEKHQTTIHSYFPKAKLEVIKNAGHWVQAEKPTEFCKSVEAFISN